VDLGLPANEENETARFYEAALVLKRKAITVGAVCDMPLTRFGQPPPGVHSPRYN
jgi:purine-nucleoside phosphorylase